MDEFVRKLRETPPHATADGKPASVVPARSKRPTSLLEHERLYGKDGECPAAWTEWLAQSGAIPDELLFHGSNDFLKFLPDEVCCRPLSPFPPPH